MAKDDYLLNIGLSDTRWGVCKGTTKQGKPCRHTVIYGNGYCAQHGGVTSAEDKASQLSRVKAKLLKRARRTKNKWQASRSSKCSLTGSVKVSINTGSHVEAGLPSKPNAPVSGDASGTVGMAVREQTLKGSPTSKARNQQRLGKEHSPTLRQADSLGVNAQRAASVDRNGMQQKRKETPSFSTKRQAYGTSSKDSLSNKEPRQENEPKVQRAPGEGERVAPAPASDVVPGYSRGNRAMDWAVVGQDSKGRQLVVVPEWHWASVPRGVDGPHQINARWPHKSLVEPKTFPD